MEPYIILSIDELNSNTYSTNPKTQKIFSKAVFDKEFRYNQTRQGTRDPLTRGWIYYKNNDDDITEFYPKSLTELTNLNIKILRPNGSIYSNVKDNLEVTNIKNNNSKITITLNKSPPEGYFMKGDRIRIDGIVENNPINQYLNEGAYILEDSTSNTIIVNNKLIDDDKYLEFKNLNFKNNAFIINENLQHSIILEVECEEAL